MLLEVRKNARNVSNEDLQWLLSKVESARQAATFERASLDDITRPNEVHTVVEKDVTQFVRRRCELHHKSWVLSPLDQVIELLQGKLETRS